MKVLLNSKNARISMAAVVLLLVAVFLATTTLQFAAAVLSEGNDLASLERAVRLQPYDAEYHYRLGVYRFLLQPEAAAQSFRAAVALNPYRAAYWIALARAYESLGDSQAQAQALSKASATAPTDPDIIWETANAYFSRGDTEETLNQCRNLLQDDGPMFGNALPFCWRVNPDIDIFVQKLLPRRSVAYQSLLALLISKHDTSASARTWQVLTSLHSHVPRQQVFNYVRYLLMQQQAALALRVWEQAAPLADLSEYQPSESNLVVNGGFESRVLDGGFDWLYQKSRGVSLSLDPEQHASRGRSLLISFNGAQIEDAGIRQFVPVHPNATYNFSSDFKTREMEGAGGIRFAIQDAYSGSLLYASDNLNSGDWQQVNGSFIAGPNTTLLTLRLQRLPANDVIKGKLWIDDVRLREEEAERP